MAASSSLTQQYVRTSDVISTDVAGDLVLLHTQNWNYFEFDKIAASIWKLLDAPRSLPALVEALVAEFEVDEAVCLSDTKAFLDDMIAQGLVTIVEG